MRVLPLALALAAFAVAAPAAQLTRSATKQPPLARTGPAFVLDLDSSGGFTGRGRGGLTVTSDGTTRASRSIATDRASSDCQAKLSDGDLERVKNAIAAATQQPWPAKVVPEDDGCCDRMSWRMRVELRDNDKAQTFSTSWFDTNEARLPKELAALREVAVGLLGQTLTGCRK
jgi:hypothetical protein